MFPTTHGIVSQGGGSEAPTPSTPVVGSSVTAYTNENSVTVNFPAGIQAGDLVLIFDHVDGGTNGHRFSQPTGWTRSSYDWSNGRRGASYRRVYQAGDGASVNLSSSSSGNRIVSMVTLRGVTYDSLDHTGASLGSEKVSPSLTMSGAGWLVTWFCSLKSASGSFAGVELSVPAGMTSAGHTILEGEMKQRVAIQAVGSGATGARTSSEAPDETFGGAYAIGVVTA